MWVFMYVAAEGVEYSKQHELRGPGPNIYVCVKYRCLACPCSRFMKLVCLLLSLNDENVMEVHAGGWCTRSVRYCCCQRVDRYSVLYASNSTVVGSLGG